MTEIEALYRDLIVDHSREPHNFRALASADHVANGHNPLCGDEVTVYLKMEGDRIEEITFQGKGCAISKASASLMTDSVKKLDKVGIAKLFEGFHGMVTGEKRESAVIEKLGKLAVFQGVSEFPVRVKCATMPWHTLKAALESKSEVNV